MVMVVVVGCRVGVYTFHGCMRAVLSHSCPYQHPRSPVAVEVQ